MGLECPELMLHQAEGTSWGSRSRILHLLGVPEALVGSLAIRQEVAQVGPPSDLSPSHQPGQSKNFDSPSSEGTWPAFRECLPLP